MDYTNWVQMQQNPNPNSNPSLIHATNQSAGYSQNPVSDHYQQSSTDSHNALLLVAQPRPPGVDPLYVPTSETINYATQPIGYEPQATTVNYAQQSIGYEPQLATLNYAQQPIGYEPQQGAEAAVASYYVDPIVGWAAATSQFGATPYATGVSIPNPTNQLQNRHTWKKVPKRTKVVQSAWCEVCKIDCNSKGVLDQHKLGKKHLKNLEKLKAKTAPTPAPTVASSTPVITVNLPALVSAPPPTTIPASASLPVSGPALAPTDKPVIGPQENPDKPKPNAQKARKKAAATEDLDTKRRRVLEGGAAADCVRACSLCNVVCNSDTVFNYHLAGQKHASMVKKFGVNGGVAFAM